MRKLVMVIAVFLSASQFSYAASLSSMNKSQASSTFTDKTITTLSAATLNGKVIQDSFSGYFGKDGKMNGKFSSKPADTPQADEGTWLTKSNGQVCFTWTHWNEGKERCVTLYKLNNAVLIIGPDNVFETLIMNDNIKSGNQL